MVVCLEQGADLHMAQLMPLPLTVSCFSKIQIGFTFLVPAHLGCPGQRACVCVCVWLLSWAGVLARNSRVIDLVLNIHVGERDVLIGRQHIGVCSQVAVGVGGNS